MGFVIVTNAVTIGVEASITRSGKDVPLWLQAMEYAFLIIYTVELCLRFAAHGRRAICNAWVQFDLFLVACGCFDVVTNAIVKDGSVTFLDHVLLVRVFRLARLARVLRLMIKFHTLWMLVQGLVNSLMTLVWTCIIICILLFIFSVLGLEMLQPWPDAGEEFAEYNKIVEQHFGGLLEAMTSLLQGLTLDSFSAIYRPVMLARPVTVLYFVPFLLVVSIALMNLVTALMVNFSLEQASKDKQMQEQVLEQHKAELVKILEQAFRELDTNHSGHIDLKEMLDAPDELRTLIFEIGDVEDETQGDIAYMFNTLDFDNSGFVEISEFCEGLLKMHDRKALESYVIMKCCANIMNATNSVLKGGQGQSSNQLPSERPSNEKQTEVAYSQLAL